MSHDKWQIFTTKAKLLHGQSIQTKVYQFTANEFYTYIRIHFIDHIKKISILKNGIGIECQKL